MNYKKEVLNPLTMFPLLIDVQRRDLQARMKALEETQDLFTTILNPNSEVGKLVTLTGNEYRAAIRPIVNRIAEKNNISPNQALEMLYDKTDNKIGKTRSFPSWRFQNKATFFADYKPNQEEFYTYYRIKVTFIDTLLKEGATNV